MQEEGRPDGRPSSFRDLATATTRGGLAEHYSSFSERNNLVLWSYDPKLN